MHGSSPSPLNLFLCLPVCFFLSPSSLPHQLSLSFSFLLCKYAIQINCFKKSIRMERGSQRRQLNCSVESEERLVDPILALDKWGDSVAHSCVWLDSFSFQFAVLFTTAGNLPSIGSSLLSPQLLEWRAVAFLYYALLRTCFPGNIIPKDHMLDVLSSTHACSHSFGDVKSKNKMPVVSSSLSLYV